MRLSRLIAAVSVAALGFGGVVAASPASAAAPPSPNPVRVAGVAIAPAAINYSTNVYAETRAVVDVDPAAGAWYVYADVYVNGVLRSSKQTIASQKYPTGVATWPRSAGVGSVQLRNVRVTTYAPDFSWSTPEVAQSGVVSNVTSVRSTIYTPFWLYIGKRGAKVTAQAKNLKYYRADGSFASLGKVSLQRLKKGKWRNFKKIKLNAAGNGKIKFKQRAKFKYRIFVPTTTTLYGGYTEPTRKMRIAP